MGTTHYLIEDAERICLYVLPRLMMSRGKRVWSVRSPAFAFLNLEQRDGKFPSPRDKETPQLEA